MCRALVGGFGRGWLLGGLCVLLLFSAAFTTLAGPPTYSARARLHPVLASNGLVVSQDALASQVGLAILRQGGRAVDAAVAVGFALAVTLPQAGNLGGGGFLLVHDAAKDLSEAIDFRETAPAAAHRDFYLNEQGDVDETRIRFHHQAAGVLGTVAGLALAHERHASSP